MKSIKTGDIVFYNDPGHKDPRCHNLITKVLGTYADDHPFAVIRFYSTTSNVAKEHLTVLPVCLTHPLRVPRKPCIEIALTHRKTNILEIASDNDGCEPVTALIEAGEPIPPEWDVWSQGNVAGFEDIPLSWFGYSIQKEMFPLIPQPS